jgi:hypothetical protein
MSVRTRIKVVDGEGNPMRQAHIHYVSVSGKKGLVDNHTNAYGVVDDKWPDHWIGEEINIYMHKKFLGSFFVNGSLDEEFVYPG